MWYDFALLLYIADTVAVAVAYEKHFKTLLVGDIKMPHFMAEMRRSIRKKKLTITTTTAFSSITILIRWHIVA